MLRRLFDCVVMMSLLLVCVAVHATTLAPYPTAKVTVNGTEQSIGGSWDNGNITIDFNGFLETVHYGQFSNDASLASALAAMFTRDYISFGLYAKAGANSNTDPTVITFQLTNGDGFGSLNVTGPSTSFTFSTSGFAATPTGVPDQGTATLSFNGAAIATASYGAGSTPASIAQDLALKASSSLVTVTAEGPNVYLQSKETGTYSRQYSLSFSTSASFSSSPGGTLSGSSDTTSVPVYSYSVTNSSGQSGYDAVGNVTNVTDSQMGTWSYGYDDLNRLISGQASGGSYGGQYLCWSYDNFGNRTHQAISNQSFANAPCQAASGASLIDTAVNYGSNNQISSVTSPALTVAYDGAGNVTNDGYNSYLYDAEGRICAVNGPQGMVGYQYDAAGNRVGRGSITTMSCDITQNGYQPASDYIVDLSGNQMTEVSVGNGQSTWQHTNVTANGTLVATYDTVGLHFYVNDMLGSRRVQTDPAGFPEQTCQNLPYGDQLYCTGSLNSPTEHHFTGKERDTESGLDYFGARYFGSSMGRFMSPDWSDKPQTVPYSDLSNPQSLNLYSYGDNNPLSKADKDGHCSAPSVADGHVGICLESYIQMARFGFLNMGHGDNRGPVANDPKATFRTQTMIDVNLGSQNATEHSTPGLSETSIGSRMGVVHDWIDGLQKGSDGSTTFTVHVYGENGYEAAHIPGAPGGWIEMAYTLKVTSDGKVSVVGGSAKKFPSVSIYSYQSNGSISDVYQQKESGNINDLNKPMSPLQDDADRLCALGNPAACNH
jgi:RHS repeat-associated protein